MDKLAPDNDARRLAELQDLEILDTTPDEAFDRLTRLAARVLEMPIALVSLVDERRLWFKSCCGLDVRETPRQSGFCAHAIMNDGVMVVPDARVDARFAENPLVNSAPHARFYAGAPLTTRQGHALGTLCVIDREPRELDARDRAVLADMAAMVVDELELRRLAATDAMTGAVNRHHFLELAHREERRAQRYAYPMSVGILQLDDFTPFVESHGPAITGQVVKAFAALCQAAMRETDIISRFGGRDFVILMPHTDEAGATRLGERLRAGTEALTIAASLTDVRVTASVGVATGPVGREELDVTLQRADNALYKSRCAGGNVVTVAPQIGAPVPPAEPRSEVDAIAQASIAQVLAPRDFGAKPTGSA